MPAASAGWPSAAPGGGFATGQSSSPFQRNIVLPSMTRSVPFAPFKASIVSSGAFFCMRRRTGWPMNPLNSQYHTVPDTRNAPMKTRTLHIGGAPMRHVAHAAIAAHLMGMPMGYVRSGSKDHGRKNRIEGKLTRGEKVVVIEDLISTAGSVVTTVEALREAGAEVLGVISICTYGMERGIHTLEAANVRAVSLTDIDTITAVAVEDGYISEADAKRVLAFRDNPLDESWRNT